MSWEILIPRLLTVKLYSQAPTAFSYTQDSIPGCSDEAKENDSTFLIRKAPVFTRGYYSEKGKLPKRDGIPIIRAFNDHSGSSTRSNSKNLRKKGQR